MIGIPAGPSAFYRDGSCSGTIWRSGLTNVEMKPIESFEALPTNAKRETATVAGFSWSRLIMDVTRIPREVLPDAAALLKAAGMVFLR